MRWRRLRGPRVEKGIVGGKLSQVLFVAHLKVTKVRVLWVRTVRALARKSPHYLGGDDCAHRLSWRVHEIQVMRLPAEIARRRPEHVVREHCGELRARAAEGARHCRIHVARAEVRRIELVHDAGE